MFESYDLILLICWYFVGYFSASGSANLWIFLLQAEFAFARSSAFSSRASLASWVTPRQKSCVWQRGEVKRGLQRPWLGTKCIQSFLYLGFQTCNGAMLGWVKSKVVGIRLGNCVPVDLFWIVDHKSWYKDLFWLVDHKSRFGSYHGSRIQTKKVLFQIVDHESSQFSKDSSRYHKSSQI